MQYSSAEYIKAMKAPIKQTYIKLQLFDYQNIFLKEITRSVTKSDVGQISIDYSRPVRRSFSFSLLNKDNEFDFGSQNTIWIDKRVKLFTGLKLLNGTIEYIPQGVFVLTEPQNTHTLGGKIATIVGQDKAILLTDRRGAFVNQTTLAAGLNVSTAIKTIAGDAGETMFNFDTIIATIPYLLTYEAGSSRWQAISELALLAQCDIYYDVDGYLRLRKIDLNEFSTLPPVWSFNYGDATEKFYAGNVRKMSVENLSNHVIAIAGSSQTAIARYELKVTNTDPLWTNSPYTIEKIGDYVYFHNNANPDPILTTIGDCKFRCKYELMHRLGFSEQVSLSISPHYLLDVNDVIKIEDIQNSVSGNFIIRSMSIPINPQLMTIECQKYNAVISDWNFI